MMNIRSINKQLKTG